MKSKSIIISDISADEYDNFLAIKESETIIYTPNMRDCLSDPLNRGYVESDEFLRLLIEAVEDNYIKKIYDDNIKKNIYDLLAYLQKNKPYESTTDRAYLLNNLNYTKSLLKKSTDEKSLQFYVAQYFIREDIKIPITKRELSLSLEGLVGYVMVSISSDFAPLFELSNLYSDKEFSERIIFEYAKCHNFINTLNMLFIEKPSMYSNKYFLERAIKVLELNSLLLKGKNVPYDIYDHIKIEPNIKPRNNKLLEKLKRINR